MLIQKTLIETPFDIFDPKTAFAVAKDLRREAAVTGETAWPENIRLLAEGVASLLDHLGNEVNKLVAKEILQENNEGNPAP